MGIQQQLRDAFYIGGEWVAPTSKRRFELINAATEELIGSVPEAVEADVDRAVAAARRAFDSLEWSQSTPADRAAAIGRFVVALQKRSDAIARDNWDWEEVERNPFWCPDAQAARRDADKQKRLAAGAIKAARNGCYREAPA